MKPKKLRNYEVWGLTGGIAAGQSTVAHILEASGIPVVDADQLARVLSSQDGLAHDDIMTRFGTSDRKSLRKIIFSDSQARSDLEAILHPWIEKESTRCFEELAESIRKRGVTKPVIVYEAALLVETHRDQTLDGLIVVESSPTDRQERLIQRDAISPSLAKSMIAAQISDEERRQAATEILFNSGNLADLETQVNELIHRRGWKA